MRAPPPSARVRGGAGQFFVFLLSSFFFLLSFFLCQNPDGAGTTPISRRWRGTTVTVTLAPTTWATTCTTRCAALSWLPGQACAAPTLRCVLWPMRMSHPVLAARSTSSATTASHFQTIWTACSGRSRMVPNGTSARRLRRQTMMPSPSRGELPEETQD
jgi:hypothetical protein